MSFKKDYAISKFSMFLSAPFDDDDPESLHVTVEFDGPNKIKIDERIQQDEDISDLGILTIRQVIALACAKGHDRINAAAGPVMEAWLPKGAR